MNIHLFDLKSEMVNRGITSLDFMENNFRVNYEDTKLTISKIFLVEDKHICRPDMVSFDAYGSVEYVDIILKFNHISNPFSMELYDLIVVPKLNTAIRFYKKDPLKTEKMLNDTKGLFVDPSRASKKDQERLKLLKEIAKKSKNGSSEIKPTNLLRDGEAPFTSNGDIIVFAPNSSAPRKIVNTNESLIKTNNSNI
jgi:hypothetical protein